MQPKLQYSLYLIAICSLSSLKAAAPAPILQMPRADFEQLVNREQPIYGFEDNRVVFRRFELPRDGIGEGVFTLNHHGWGVPTLNVRGMILSLNDCETVLTGPNWGELYTINGQVWKEERTGRVVTPVWWLRCKGTREDGTRVHLNIEIEAGGNTIRVHKLLC